MEFNSGFKGLISTVRLRPILYDEPYSVRHAGCTEYTSHLDLQTKDKTSQFLHFSGRFIIICFCSSIRARLLGFHTDYRSTQPPTHGVSWQVKGSGRELPHDSNLVSSLIL